MESVTTKVVGTVEAVGVKFNGSLLVNNKWYNFAKGVKNPAAKGDSVILTLESWEAYGKSGVNIVEVKVDAVASSAVPKTAMIPASALKSFPATKVVSDNAMSKDEWAAKDRRISRQGCIQIAVQVTSNFDKAVELADKMLGYVNG